ncbi:MAG: GDSL-type esterase/lipase family protein [Candidatus Goldbacteria bacterium]|nr:GDSL-type esterase/lipase family protein [Candidatus Goldiibacteriota bacterium]
MDKFSTLQVLSVILFTCSTVIANSYNNIIPPLEKHFNFYGRFDFSEKNLVKFDWPGCAIEFSFKGSGFKILLEDGFNDFNIIIDKKLHKIIKTKPGKFIYIAAKNLKNTEHNVLIAKKTESFEKPSIFKGIILNQDSKILPPPLKPKYKIEFIGDSITVGYGNESRSIKCKDFKNWTNNYLSYAQITARELNAEASIIAISGKGIVRNYGEKKVISQKPLPYYYDKTLLTQDNKKWNFKNWKSDITVICLGTNDFSTTPHPSKEVFIKSYRKLISQIKSKNKNTKIFIMGSPTLEEPLNTYLTEIAKKEKIKFIKLPKTPVNQLGCDWHPNVFAHQKIAEILIKEIRKYMHQ